MPPSPLSYSRTFLSFPKGTPCPSAVTPCLLLSLIPQPLQPLARFLSPWICLLQAFLGLGTQWHVVSVTGFFLSTDCSRFIHVAGRISSGFLFMAEWNPIVRTDHTLFILSSADRRLGCFYFLAVGINAAMNTSFGVNTWTQVLISLRSGIAGFMETLV